MTSNISTQDINQGNEDFEAELEQLNNQIISMKDTAEANLRKLNHSCNHMYMSDQSLSRIRY